MLLFLFDMAATQDLLTDYISPLIGVAIIMGVHLVKKRFVWLPFVLIGISFIVLMYRRPAAQDDEVRAAEDDEVSITARPGGFWLWIVGFVGTSAIGSTVLMSFGWRTYFGIMEYTRESSLSVEICFCLTIMTGLFLCGFMFGEAEEPIRKWFNRIGPNRRHVVLFYSLAHVAVHLGVKRSWIPTFFIALFITLVLFALAVFVPHDLFIDYISQSEAVSIVMGYDLIGRDYCAIPFAVVEILALVSFHRPGVGVEAADDIEIFHNA